MATSSTALQQTTNFGIQNWQAFYQAFNNPDLASYDFETLRQSMINYLQQYNPENFNDYTSSSEYMALVDIIAYMGQALSYRFDLNARENFISTAQTRASVTNLANLVNYQPSRNLAANGYLKFLSISANDEIYDSFGNNLNGQVINWNDSSNLNWQDQWNSIVNAVLINSQTVGNPGNSQSINGILYSEYALSCPPEQASPYNFTATIDNNTTSFQLVNPTSVGESYIYEVDPYNSEATFNLLYETDGQGYNSPNTGFFFYFKQGSLSTQSFNFTNALPNTSLSLGITGINNTDVWLYAANSDGSYTQWTQVPAIYGENTAFNNLPGTEKTIFSIENGSNDTITLVFGDGVFGAIPQGNFICYARSSNGLVYRINPSEMSDITLSIPYLSKTSRTQYFTVTASLLYTVGNSAATESLANIKLKAPQSFYSQNRMVNGQDYNSFPFTQYSSILQIKAVNRTSSGVSRYLDVVDPTGKYSSTNVFCDDGFIYLDSGIITNNFTFSNLNNLAAIVQTQIANTIADSTMLSFIFNNYPSFSIPTASIVGTYGQQVGSVAQWNLTLTDNTSGSGYLGNVAADSVSINAVMTINDAAFANASTANASVLVPGAVLSFIPPANYWFDTNNNLVLATTASPGLNQKNIIYATIVGTPTNAGLGNSLSMNGVNVDGTGAILLNEKVPTGALLNAILPYYAPVLPANIIQNLITYISNQQAVALQYNPWLVGNQAASMWSLVPSPNFPLNFNPATSGSTFVAPVGSTLPILPATNNWLLSFIPGTGTNSFIMYQQSNAYYFGSEKQTSFYLDANAKVYDPINATTLSDQISILSTNSAASSTPNLGLPQNINVDIFGTVNEINGTIDSSRVAIQYAGLESVGFPANPTFFTDCVGLNPAANLFYIFFVTNNTENTTTLIPSGPEAVVIVANPSTITNNLYSYANGSILYSISNRSFYQISRIGNVATKSPLNNPGDVLTYSCFLGRQNLKFQYQHNAADNRRIDPSPANIIDIYCLDSSYAIAYQQWVTDITGQVAEPAPPSTETLTNDFAELNNYKMISDQLVFNSAQFVPLFGNKADPSQQATFVVVANQNIPVSAGEIASQIITHVNNFFAIGNFSFGQTFYWSQLSNYVLTQMGTLINAVHLVPTAGNLNYGALEQITCNPYEIFINCATVQNVSVVTSLNNLNLRIS